MLIQTVSCLTASAVNPPHISVKTLCSETIFISSNALIKR